MNFELLLLALLPLVLFVFVELKYGHDAGIKAALAATLVLFGYWYFRTGEIDETLLIEGGLLLVLGVLSLRLKDTRFFKFQPTVVAVLFAMYFLYFQIQGDPVLSRWMRMLEPMAGEQMSQFIAHPNFELCMAEGSLHLIWLFLVQGLFVAWGALKLSSIGWLLTRLSIYPLMIGVSFYLGLCMR